MRAPGVTIRAGRFGCLSKSRQPQVKHMPPRAKLADVLIAQPGLFHGAKEIKAKVIRALGERGVFQNRLHNSMLIRRRNRIGEHTQDVRMLAEVAMSGSISQKPSRRVPAGFVNRLGGSRPQIAGMGGLGGGSEKRFENRRLPEDGGGMQAQDGGLPVIL